jgi:hypothetical protein
MEMSKRRKKHEAEPIEHNALTRFIDKAISTFLFVALFGLFITIFRRIFGTSDVVMIVGLIICMPLAGITSTITAKAFGALMILLLFAFPAVALILMLLFV